MDGVETEGRGESFSTRERIFLAAVFAFGILVHCYLHSFVLTSNTDDMAVLQSALRTRAEGFSGYWDTARHFAESQGRFYLVYAAIFTQIPYFIDAEVIRASLLSLIYCLTGLVVALFITKIAREKTVGLLFFPLYLFSMPIYWRWHPYVHWPIYWQLPVCIFLLSQFLCIKVFYNRKRAIDYRFLAAYFVLAFFSISFSENFFLNFGLVSLLVFIVHEIRTYEKPARFGRFAPRFFLQFAPYILFLGLWLSFEKENPGRVGNLLFGTLSFAPAAVAATLLQFMKVSLPLNSITLAEAREYLGNFFAATNRQEPGWLFSLPVLVILMSLAVSVSLFHLVLRREGAPPPAKREGGEVRPRFHSLIAIGISLGFTVTSVILYCIIGTYQEWVSRWRWYTPVFYSSICLLVAVSFALQWVIAVVRACSWSCLKRLARVVLTLAVAALFSTSGVAYLGIKDKFEYVNTDLWLSWKLSRNARFFEGMYNMAFLKTARKIKGQETECINGIFGHAIAMTRDEVFGALTEDGKNVSPEIEIPSGKTVYYMEVVRPGNIHQSFLHVSRLEKLLWDGKRYRPTGREFALVVFEGKPDRFVAAIPVSNGRGEIQTAAETRWVGDVLLGRFQEAVYLNTITHQDFKPSE